jgi:hypothetical protein
MDSASTVTPTAADRKRMRANAGARLALIAESFTRLTGQELVESVDGDLESALWNAPRAILAHGTQDPPLFFYANRLGLTLFAMTAEQIIGLPSYRSAEPALREERAAMLAKLEADNVIADYSGIRIGADGRRFMIERAYVWNLVDEHGSRHGQAATWSQWHFV